MTDNPGYDHSHIWKLVGFVNRDMNQQGGQDNLAMLRGCLILQQSGLTKPVLMSRAEAQVEIHQVSGNVYVPESE